MNVTSFESVTRRISVSIKRLMPTMRSTVLTSMFNVIMHVIEQNVPQAIRIVPGKPEIIEGYIRFFFYKKSNLKFLIYTKY